ncbi:rho guanine nucleotide exchange factor 12 isoform X3 [Microplitis mediator]|uniref:rho guanine nucleotide exchange factor 12 isoform X3 n=1 Tax=Microplitis mediator TaxID=375433 RepID=UPI00255517E0|nr:rho guanine nucleotide exchange factor 12 isoform X3 [Microplitis mediator]
MNGTTAVRRVVGAGGGGGGQEPPPVATLVVYKDDAGYGMKVSGDNPVYVQSVKEGGAAERAGLKQGDKIIKVNGVNVMQSTHTEVVQLIKSSTQVVLTVQQKPLGATLAGLQQVGTTLGNQHQQPRPTSLSSASTMVSPSQSATSLHRASTAPAGGAPCTARITGPQPVDHSFPFLMVKAPSFTDFVSTAFYKKHEKKRQLETQRVHTFQLMLEKEQSYRDKLRSELAKMGIGSGNVANSSTLQTELAGAERRVRTLQDQLAAITTNDQLCSLVTNASSPSGHYSSSGSSTGGGSGVVIGDTPPPLPSRKSLSMQSLSPPPLPPRPPPPTTTSNTHSVVQLELERQLLTHLTSPTTSHGIPNSFSQDAHLGSPNSLNKHQRTKSSPEQLGSTMISPSEASRLLIASESMNDLSPSRHLHQGHGRLSGIDLDDPIHITPPGTPPPPYPLPSPGNDVLSTTLNESVDSFVTVTPTRQLLNESSPGLPQIQQPIMSMEDDDMSDQEVGQLEDHGPFKSLSRLWEHHAHLSVFINYVLSNSDPSSLLFYLVTDLYKEGNAKEMRKWAYEIHSSFLVPGAPLRLNNVDENVAREIDDVLLRESDKEEILRKIFWKARTRAKEELNEQLADFQQKRTAGLGMLFGPSDAQLDESESDKSKEAKIIETYLLPKMDPYLEDIEKDQLDLRQFTTAAGLATILTKIFQVRSVSLDRVPTFVAKDKSNIKARLLTGKTRKMAVRGHHFGAHQYFTVTYCNHCQLIIGGIGPQGYQCNDCSLSVHRQCVRVVEESCPGPLSRKERGNDRISKLMDRIRPERKPPSSHHHHHSPNQMHLNNKLFSVERSKRLDEENLLGDCENGDHRGGGASGNTRGSVERGRISGYGDHLDSMDDPSSREDISEMVQQNISSKPKTSNINRSESYKERIHHKRQLREKRKTSDPNLSKTNDCDATGAFPGNSAGSSSNSSLSTRSLDSPSTSLEQVHPANAGHHTSNSWDSDVDVEPDPPDWNHGVAEEVLSNLSNSEKKRQEVINELFHTERSHVRALKVLSYVFHKPLLESQVLPLDQVQLLFSNLDEMVTIHSRFNQAMKRKKKENPCVGDVGELILEMFDGENGETFERAASTYCAKQQVALDALRDRRRKDPKLNSFLNEIESNPLCRRLQLKDHILTGMLRLTKYPLLFENLAKYTPESNEKEKAAVLRAVERSKEILSLVNQAVREAEDCQRLTEILRMIDRSAFDKFDHPAVQEFKNLDITKRNLIFEGPLQWRIVNRPKPVDLHVVLLDDTILLLHRQDDKYLLKFTNTNQVNSVLSPIFKVSTVLVRNNAVDKNSLYLVNTSQKGAQIYDLVASSPAERKLWCKHISEAAEAYKTRNREGRRPSPPTVLNEEPSPAPEVPLNMETGAADKEKSDKVGPQDSKDNDNHKEKEQSSTSTETTTTSTPAATQPEENTQDTPATDESSKSKPDESTQSADQNHNQNQDQQQQQQQQPSPAQQPPPSSSSATSSGIGESMRLVTCTQCSLIDPVEVHAEVRPVHVAEPVLTPIESLRRLDEVIKQALEEKQSLVADILNIPKEDFEHVADIASEPSGAEKEPAELILAAISQNNQLVGIINSALTVTETEAVLATRGTNATASTGCDAVGCPVPRSHPHPHQPVIPVVTLQPICHSLTAIHSQLLKSVKENDEKGERSRKQLHRITERLHAIDADAQRKDREQYQFSTSTTQTPTDLEDHISTEATEDINKEEFVDACGDPDVELETNDNKKNAPATEMMGDSVG